MKYMESYMHIGTQEPAVSICNASIGLTPMQNAVSLCSLRLPVSQLHWVTRQMQEDCSTLMYDIQP